MVDTSDAATPDVSQTVNVVPEGSKLVTVDTMVDEMDEIIKEPSPQRARSPPQARPVPQPKPVRTRPAKAPSPAPQPRKLLDGQAAFQEALKETIPGSPAPLADEEEDEQEEPEEEVAPIQETEELPAGMMREEDDEEEDDGKDEDDGDVEEQKKEEPEEDEDVVKLRLLEEINEFIASGYLPPQQPSFSMDIPTLTKIKEFQERAASDAFGIQMIGYGWISLINILETVNERFDPAAKVFGPGRGLKLHGVTEKVSKNIRRYRPSFKYLWKKLGNKKLEEYSPLIALGLVTVEIFKNVHMENVRREMRQSAAAELQRPGAYGDAIKMQQRQPVPSQPVPVQPAPVVDEQLVIKPVDQIEIPVSDAEEDEASPAADDDEIEVEVPKGRKSRARK
jgi:hypothetical protein